MSITFGGNGMVTRTRPFSGRLLKSLAFSPLMRKSSASIGGTADPGVRIPPAVATASA